MMLLSFMYVTGAGGLIMKVLRELERYIHQTLGLDVQVKSWSDEKKVPCFLTDAYGFFLLELMGKAYLLMVDRQEDETPPATVGKHIKKLLNVWPNEVIYVREQVTGLNRNRLIQHQIPFVVPANQLYLPMLAMDLRERWLAGRQKMKNLSPCAQLVVLQSIYKKRMLLDEKMTLTEWGEELGYTKMSMTRAFREIRAVFDEKVLDETLCGRGLWERLHPLLKNPVKKHRFYITTATPMGEYLLAGDSALARYTMLAEQNHQTVCMDSDEWKQFQVRFDLVEVERSEPGALEVEIWNYSPRLLAQHDVADPLSVWLSYGGNQDERVERALDELLEVVSW
jgi:hypothetical protein